MVQPMKRSLIILLSVLAWTCILFVGCSSACSTAQGSGPDAHLDCPCSQETIG